MANFYEYYAGILEPWDGPANVTFCNGKILGAKLDKNGLRPARFDLTEDGYVYYGSEIGSCNISQGKIIQKGRLGPGNMIALDLENNRLITNDEIKQEISVGPYGECLKQRINLEETLEDFKDQKTMDKQDSLITQTKFGMTSKDFKIILSMA